MQAIKEVRNGVRPTMLIAALLSAALLSGAAGFVVRGELPRSQALGVTTSVAVPHEQAPATTDNGCVSPTSSGLTC